MEKPSHYIPGDASSGALNPDNLNYRVDFIPFSNGDGTFDQRGFYPPPESPIEFEAYGEDGLILGYTASVQIKIHENGGRGGQTWSRHENCVIAYSTDRSKNGREFKVYSYNDIKQWRETKKAIPGFDT